MGNNLIQPPRTHNGLSAPEAWSPGLFRSENRTASHGEVDKSPLRVGGDQLGGHFIANIQALASTNHHAVHWRIECPHERAALGDAGDDGREALADAGMQDDGRDALLHVALYFACVVFHKRAVNGYGVEIVFGV